MELLQVELREQDGWTVLTLVGQLDVATAPDLRQSLQEAQYGGERSVVLDLSGLEFLDSFGLGVLVGGLRRARLREGRLVLAAVGERIHQVLEVTGLTEAFELAGSVEEVLGS